MKRVLVTGGTGTLGTAIVKQLIDAKLSPYILTTKPSHLLPIEVKELQADLTDKTGLLNAVSDTNFDTVIHCASNPKNAEDVDVKGTTNLLEVLSNTNCNHLIYISIVGVDQSSYSYYKNKLKVEREIRNSKHPWSILRITQFHDFVLNRIIYSSKDPDTNSLRIPKDLKFQSIAVDDVAKYIVSLSPTMSVTNLGGPQILTIEEMVQAYLEVTNKSCKVESIDIENDFYKIFKSGINLCPFDKIGTVSWEVFLRSKLQQCITERE